MDKEFLVLDIHVLNDFVSRKKVTMVFIVNNQGRFSFTCPRGYSADEH